MKYLIIEVVDFSFEVETFTKANPSLDAGFWYQNDRAELSKKHRQQHVPVISFGQRN